MRIYWSQSWEVSLIQLMPPNVPFAVLWNSGFCLPFPFACLHHSTSLLFSHDDCIKCKQMFWHSFFWFFVVHLRDSTSVQRVAWPNLPKHLCWQSSMEKDGLRWTQTGCLNFKENPMKMTALLHPAQSAGVFSYFINRSKSYFLLRWLFLLVEKLECEAEYWKKRQSEQNFMTAVEFSLKNPELWYCGTWTLAL